VTTVTKKTVRATLPTRKRLQKISAKVKHVGSAKLKFSGGLGNYAAALQNPFVDAACGARVPDMNSAPTVTYHSKGTVTLQSNANGVLSLVLTANPLLSMIDMTLTSVGNTGMSQYFTTTAAYAVTSLVNAQTAFQSMRVVGAGFRIRNLIPPTTATGKVIVAPFCMSSSQPGPATLSNVLIDNYQLANYVAAPGAQSNAVLGLQSNIIELPGSEEYTVQELITNAVHCWLKPIAPTAFNFHNLYDATQIIGSFNYLAGSAEFTSGAVFNASNSDVADVCNWAGFEGIVIRGEGLPPGVSCLEVEYIYHFEGTPFLSPTSGGQLIPTAAPSSFVDINGFNSVLSNALNHPVVSLVEAGVRAGVGALDTPVGHGLLANMMARMGLSIGN